MPFYSTLKTLTLGFITFTAIHNARATVVIPHVVYQGIPNERVRFSDEIPWRQSRIGVQLAIGSPMQFVYIPPNFHDSGTYVNNASVCDFPTDDTPQALCEAFRSGLFATNESSSFKAGTPWSTDTVTFLDSVPTLMRDDYEVGIINDVNYENFVGRQFGTLGLGPNSTFINTFFPGKEQIGIYFPGENSTHGLPPSSIDGLDVLYELEFDGYNQSHFTGPKHTQKIGPPSPLSNSSIPFVLTVTGMAIGKEDILAGGPFDATADLIGGYLDIFPSAVFQRFVEVTKAFNASSPGAIQYKTETLPKDPKDWYNLTITFSNGFVATVPQNALIKSYYPPDNTAFAIATIVNASEEALMNELPIKGPVFSLATLMASSYIGIDHAAGEWWLAKPVLPYEAKVSLAVAVGGDPKLFWTVFSAASLAAALIFFA
ncbi:hypothetical protein ABW20_dc0102305 [Dactylellina cionopaga]|nr:hypothetical protein ABW20_dc0102305 [Dactylellina cionopaga]